MSDQIGYFKYVKDPITGLFLTIDETATLSSKRSISSPTLPAFLVTSTAGQDTVTGDGTSVNVVFGTEVFDQANNFDGTSTFTASLSGRYRLSTNVVLNGLAANHTRHYVGIVTSNRSFLKDVTYTSNPFIPEMNVTLSVLADMDAGDTAVVHITIIGGSKVVGIAGSATKTYFCGELVC